jgi:hypothetical protein
MVTSGVSVSLSRRLFSASVSILGEFSLCASYMLHAHMPCSYGGYDNPTWGHGVRNVVFSTPDPTVGPKTWIRLEEGEIRGQITLDKAYN